MSSPLPGISYLPGAVLVLYRFQPQLELLMIQRAAHLRAFANAWAFPGGRSDASDSLGPEAEHFSDFADRQTALRELFEETGLLPGYRGAAELLVQLHTALNQGELDWQSCCQQLNYQAPYASLQPVGLRVGPPIHLQPFEAQYYLLPWESAAAEFLASAEVQAVAWVQPAALLERWQQAEVLIPPPVLAVLKTLAEVTGPELLDSHWQALRAQANSREQLFKEIEIHPGIQLIPLRTPTLAPATHTNTYLVGQERFVIIDPASPYPDQQDFLKACLQARLDQGHEPQAILLTHQHTDHVGAVNFIRDWLKLPVMAHAHTAELLSPQIPVDQLLADGQLLELGTDPATGAPWQLQAVFTPGHAPGHLCFLDLRHRVAIVGDMLAAVGTILIKRPRGNMAQYLASLERLRDLHLTRALPAHGGMIMDPAAHCQQYIDHRLMREAKILAALEPGGLNAEALLDKVYAELQGPVLKLAALSLEAHLHKLLQEKRLQLGADGRYQLLHSS